MLAAFVRTGERVSPTFTPLGMVYNVRRGATLSVQFGWAQCHPLVPNSQWHPQCARLYIFQGTCVVVFHHALVCPYVLGSMPQLFL